MTPFENLIQSLVSVTIDGWFFIKLLFLLGFLFYIAFAIVVVRQINLMIQTLDGVLNLPLKLIAWVHLGVALLIFFLALTIL